MSNTNVNPHWMVYINPETQHVTIVPEIPDNSEYKVESVVARRMALEILHVVDVIEDTVTKVEFRNQTDAELQNHMIYKHFPASKGTVSENIAPVENEVVIDWETENRMLRAGLRRMFMTSASFKKLMMTDLGVEFSLDDQGELQIVLLPLEVKIP